MKSETKTRPYSVRADAADVVVEHRMTVKPRWVVGIVLVYLGVLCCLPEFRQMLAGIYRSHDPLSCVGILCFLVFPWLAQLLWLRLASGEVMRCDRKELQFARRGMMGRWKRYRFAAGEVRSLQLASRNVGRSSYSVLTFQHAGQPFDMLENISADDARRVLKGCKQMGVDAVEVPVDPGEGMLRDIEKRGWWVNPLKADRGEGRDSAEG